MLDYLRACSDDIIKGDVVRRIGELAERFAPDTQWFIDTMNQVGLLTSSAVTMVCYNGCCAGLSVLCPLQALESTGIGFAHARKHLGLPS